MVWCRYMQFLFLCFTGNGILCPECLNVSVFRSGWNSEVKAISFIHEYNFDPVKSSLQGTNKNKGADLAKWVCSNYHCLNCWTSLLRHHPFSFSNNKAPVYLEFLQTFAIFTELKLWKISQRLPSQSEDQLFLLEIWQLSILFLKFTF